MINAELTVSGIIMCCDESIVGLNLGRGYTIRKLALGSLPFKDRITNGQGTLNADYYGSRLIKDGTVYFMCICKETKIQIEGPRFTGGMQVFTDKEMMCEEEISQHANDEMQYLNQVINLLRLFKAGNIGFADVFFTYKFKMLGIMDNTVNNSSYNKTRNTIDARRYVLSTQEIGACNQFIVDFIGAPYVLMENSINEFAWGLEQIDVATGFEQYTTALEMTLLAQNQTGKKQALANRVAAMLGSNQADIIALHQKMIDFYRYRSESLHEGDGSNITLSELQDMEEIVRQVLKVCLIRCKREISQNSCVTWETIKNALIADLMNQVINLKAQGILPT